MRTPFRISFLIGLIAVFSSCGHNGSDSKSNTGGIAFSLTWETPSRQKPARISSAPAPDVCNDFAIVTINERVQNSSGGTVASGQWACSAHSAVINGIPAGGNYTLIVEGVLADNSTAWTGTKSALSVVANKTTQAGTVSMSYQGSDSISPTVLSATPAAGASNVPVTSPVTAIFSEDMAISTINESTFTVKQGTTPISGTVTYSPSNKTAIFMPSANFSYSTLYSATVTTGAKDMANRGLAVAKSWNFTTEGAPTGIPSIPDGVSATAGDSQVVITWNASTGAASYNIYWSTISSVTTTSGTKIPDITTTTYTHSSLTNGTRYYYVVTAQNSFGESAASAEVFATPSTTQSVIAVHIPDTGQTADYTATFGEDSDYTINPPSYTDNGDGTVTDNVTGLVWQQCSAGQSGTGCISGSAGTYNWDAANTYCNSNTAGLPGTGWRLPTQLELLTIVDFGKMQPSIDTTVFPNTVSTASPFYWTSDTNATISSVVQFDTGVLTTVALTAGYYTRCVNGSQRDLAFEDNANGTVTDEITGLSWQKQDSGSTMLWEEALNYCENLSLGGYGDWRLPNIKELASIIKPTFTPPTIDTTYFSNVQSARYWSSTSYSDSFLSLSWHVGFDYGYASTDSKSSGYYVRCVRGSTKAYVTKAGPTDNYVSVVNLTTNQVTKTITVGTAPTGIAVNPFINRAYVANYGYYSAGTTVSVIDTINDATVATITVGKNPWGVAVNSSTNKVYVTNYGDNTVSAIDSATNTVISTINVGYGPWGVAVNSSANRAYVANYGTNTISVIDTSTDTVLTTVTVGASPSHIALDSSANRAYVANLGDKSVSVIDTTNNTVITTITKAVDTGLARYGVAVNPSTKKAYVTNDLSGTVSVINTNTNSEIATITGDAGAWDIEIDTNSNRAYVTTNTGKFTIIDTINNSVVTSINLDGYNVALVP